VKLLKKGRRELPNAFVPIVMLSLNLMELRKRQVSLIVLSVGST